MPRTTKFYLALAGVCLFATSQFASAQEASAPTLQYIMTYQADLEPPQVIAENRLIWNVTGGWVKTATGAKGTLISPCGDWMQILPGGTFKLDVRCTVKMDDGALIFVEYTGRVKLSESGAAKWEKAEMLTSEDFYFITSPTLQTAHEKYLWMNDAVFVNKAVSFQPPGGDKMPYVRYDTYMVKP